MYSFAYFFGPYFLLASRFITGFGAGKHSLRKTPFLSIFLVSLFTNELQQTRVKMFAFVNSILIRPIGTLSVIRAYVAHVTTQSERTKYMSILGAVQFLGFAIMPGMLSLISPSLHLSN